MWVIKSTNTPWRTKWYITDVINVENVAYYPNYKACEEADYITREEAIIMVDVLNLRDYGEVAPFTQENK